MNRTDVLSIIRKFTGNANVLSIPRAFVSFAGSWDAAVLLSQTLYWSERTSDPDGWFYKSYVEWEDEIALSEYEVRKAAKKLQDRGIIETKLRKANGAPTVHYRLNEANFSESILEFLQNPISTNSRIHPEETSDSYIKNQRLLTETTTEKTRRGTGVPEQFSLRNDPLYQLFLREYENSKLSEIPYEISANDGDLAQLAKLKKGFAGTKTELTEDLFRRAIRNYFRSPRRDYTLRDLCTNFASFLRGPLDQYGKPANDQRTRPERRETHNQRAARQTYELLASIPGIEPGEHLPYLP